MRQQNNAGHMWALKNSHMAPAKTGKDVRAERG